MLVLTRRAGESIRVGDDITITIVESDGHNVKLGIEAPRSVTVHREEVFQRILEENRKAASDGSEAQKEQMAAMAKLFRKQ